MAKNDANNFKKEVQKLDLQPQVDLPTSITHLDMGIHRLNGLEPNFSVSVLWNQNMNYGVLISVTHNSVSKTCDFTLVLF